MQLANCFYLFYFWRILLNNLLNTRVFSPILFISFFPQVFLVFCFGLAGQTLPSMEALPHTAILLLVGWDRLPRIFRPCIFPRIVG